MAPSQHRRQLLAERRLTHLSSAKRSIDVVARDESASDPGSAVTLPPKGTKAIIGIVVMLSVLVLGFAAWRIYVFRSNKKKKSQPVVQHVGLFDAVDAQSIKRSLSDSSTLSPPKAALTRERNPAEFKINLGYEPKVIYIAPQPATPPSVGKAMPKVSNLAIVPNVGPPSYDQSLPKPPMSPRTVASIAPKLLQVKSDKLPRLVIVESTFPASLHDELEIRVGETLKLLEEYEDEWCLVQRVGSKYVEKGVIPRFCIVDKPENPAIRRAKHVPRLSSSSTVI